MNSRWATEKGKEIEPERGLNLETKWGNEMESERGLRKD
jgi:hypothetical protein